MGERIKSSLGQASGSQTSSMDWGLTAGMALLTVLERRAPGIKDEVRDELASWARKLEMQSDPAKLAQARSIRQLLTSSIFNR
ncbi:hypothetical protein [Sphingobium sp. Cam5-1]|uniref:hypothetical protein n=2 Tax=unclassified Sphingobium TaxID=2611147 RepID=UPI0005CC0EF9|nr:hypothetical protein [Sphingobium sp. Cam5-1]AJR26988.1 hypothetical protein TZ53_24785 [Sphingobium sp. YBL2]QPI75605.1 hypothetical protein IZV00_19365 [Sphingobium sp. Cam5-1]